MRERELDGMQRPRSASAPLSASWPALLAAFWGVNYLVWFSVDAWYGTGPLVGMLLAPLLTLMVIAVTTCPLTTLAFLWDRGVLTRWPGWITDLVLVILVALPALVFLHDPGFFQGPTGFEVQLVAQVILGALVVYLNRRTRRQVAARS
jgi:hypothetical protein